MSPSQRGWAYLHLRWLPTRGGQQLAESPSGDSRGNLHGTQVTTHLGGLERKLTPLLAASTCLGRSPICIQLKTSHNRGRNVTRCTRMSRRLWTGCSLVLVEAFCACAPRRSTRVQWPPLSHGDFPSVSPFHNL